MEMRQQASVFMHYYGSEMGPGESGPRQIPQRLLAIGVKLDGTGFD